MAGEYNDKFEEITALLRTTAGRMDELRLEVRDMRSELRDTRSELRENTSGLNSLTEKVNVLSGQFSDVGVMAIKDHKRVDDIEHRVDILEQKPH
jgi:hypothetical protein